MRPLSTETCHKDLIQQETAMRSPNAYFLSTNLICDFTLLNTKVDKYSSMFPLYLESTQMGQRSSGAVIAPDTTLSFLTPTPLYRENQSKLPYFVGYSSEVQVGPIKKNSDLPTGPELRCYQKIQAAVLVSSSKQLKCQPVIKSHLECLSTFSILFWKHFALLTDFPINLPMKTFQKLNQGLQHELDQHMQKHMTWYNIS